MWDLIQEWKTSLHSGFYTIANFGIETWNWKEFSKKLSRISQIKSSNLTSLVSFIFSVENSFVLYYKIVHYETSRECFNIVREKKRRCENFILDDEEFLRVFH